MNLQAEKMKLEKYVIAVIDILGSKDLILNEKGNDSLKTIHFLYTLEHLLINIGEKSDIKIKVYSDNILIACKINENEDQTVHTNIIYRFLRYAASIQWHLIQLGFLSRGGITIGDFFIDDIFVWGEALIRAHEIEEKFAMYPRAVIDNANFTQFCELNDKISVLIKKDVDGRLFLDYLTYNLECELEKFPYILQIVKGKMETITDQHVLYKYQWYINFHNKVYDGFDKEEWEKRWENILLNNKV